MRYWRNGRKSKYNNAKVQVDGIKFDSKREASRYLELKILQQAGQIEGLELQPKFRMKVNDFLICEYRADFKYREAGTVLPVVEDSKGFRTRDYRIKAKLFRALFSDQYEFRET